jgi:hypothetical protein
LKMPSLTGRVKSITRQHCASPLAVAKNSGDRCLIASGAPLCRPGRHLHRAAHLCVPSGGQLGRGPTGQVVSFFFFRFFFSFYVSFFFKIWLFSKQMNIFSQCENFVKIWTFFLQKFTFVYPKKIQNVNIKLELFSLT